MAHVKDDRVLETSTTTGTGSYTVSGAANGGKTFASALQDDNITVMQTGDTFWYCASDVDANFNWLGGFEIGQGTWSGSNVFARTAIRRSSNANAAVSWTNSGSNIRLICIAARADALLAADVVGSYRMRLATAEPATPPAGFLEVYGRDIGGIGVLRYKNAQGLDHSLQRELSVNGFEACFGGQATPVLVGGGPTITSVGGAASAALATTNLATAILHSIYACTAVAGNLATHISAPLRFWRGNAAGMGGYEFIARFSLLALQTGMRVFVGIQDSVTPLTNVDFTTATTPGKVGLAIIASTGNWSLVCNLTGAAPTVTALGASFPVNVTDVMELGLFVAPNGAGIGYRVRNLSTGAEATGTITTNQPANTTFLCPSIALTNNATAAIASMRFYKWTKESDN